MITRFSLLLLEFGEIYFEDFSVVYYPAASSEAESIERSVNVSFDPFYGLPYLILPAGD